MRKLIFKNHFNYDLIKRMIQWHINYYLFDRGTPVSAGVYITDACNCRCIMCDIWKTKSPSIYPRVAQERAIDGLANLGCYYYSVSGGEPTIVKDLPDRLAYAARKIPYVHMVTNGLSMTPELAQDLGSSGIKEISISIDGSEEFHNTMRGLSDAFNLAWRALDLIATFAPKIHIVVNSVLSPYNIEGLRSLNKLLDSFSKVNQKYLPLSFHELFRTQKCKSLSFQGEAATIDTIEKFLDDAISNPKVVNSAVFLRKAKRFFRGELDIIPKDRRCLYPYHAMEFDSKGCAYPCISGMGFKGGNPAEHDLEEYVKSTNYRSLQKKLEGCVKCRGTMPLCYYEPRLNFPINNLLLSIIEN